MKINKQYSFSNIYGMPDPKVQTNSFKDIYGMPDKHPPENKMEQNIFGMQNKSAASQCMKPSKQLINMNHVYGMHIEESLLDHLDEKHCLIFLK
ncbi:MAG: hypothetical protein HWD61_05925 [Parachlamydiaceae bacterium]|nr:MAG: hypothetical protein HWD61_05925 [Parachlamydiaceae bacterium]